MLLLWPAMVTFLGPARQRRREKRAKAREASEKEGIVSQKVAEGAADARESEDTEVSLENATEKGDKIDHPENEAIDF